MRLKTIFLNPPKIQTLKTLNSQTLKGYDGYMPKNKILNKWTCPVCGEAHEEDDGVWWMQHNHEGVLINMVPSKPPLKHLMDGVTGKALCVN